MARRSGGGRSSFRSSPRPAARSPPPKPVNHAPAPAPAPAPASTGVSFLGNLGASIADGMGFGAGSAVAHRAVDAVMGPRTIQHEMVNSQTAQPAPAAASAADACANQSKTFQDCLNNFRSDISKCQFYIDMLSECQKNSGGIGA
ncbi:hypothetical protein RND81_13G216400 [Saponaria officinalis]|uniref:CHCH domain-containing protein n=1 Tax=Saponaria officinalis TaxID=3572 RepID=A0AAW1H3B1_SAPOF